MVLKKQDAVISWKERGNNFAKQGNFESAISAYNTGLTFDPDNADILHNKELISRRLSDEIKSKQAEAISWKEKGNWLVKQGNFESAISAYDKGLELDPNNTDILHNKAIILNRLGRIEDAQACKKQIEVIQNPLPIEIKTIRETVQKKYKLRLFLNRLPGRNPVRVGLTLAQAGKKAEALEIFNIALSRDPNNLDALNSRAGILFSLGRLDEALVDTTKAINLNPHSSILFVNRGNIFRRMKNLERAIEDYSQALSIDHHDPVTWSIYAGILNRLKWYEKALDASDKAIGIDPTCESAWYQKGEALFALGRFENAIEAYNRAPGVYPSDKIDWKAKAEQYTKEGRCEEATKAMEWAAMIAMKKLNIQRCEIAIKKKNL
jgi:tetratricopeptide (TPR) repeat protein